MSLSLQTRFEVRDSIAVVLPAVVSLHLSHVSGGEAVARLLLYVVAMLDVSIGTRSTVECFQQLDD